LTDQRKILTNGVRAMFFSTLSFALANILVKQVSHIPPMEVVFFRCIVASAFCLIGLYRVGEDWRGSNRTLLLLRGLFGTVALYLFFVTVQNIPLASAMTLQYLSPIFTTIIAIFVLKEGVRPLQWAFFALAFCGVLLIQRFDPRISPVLLLMGIASAFCSGVAYNLVRSLKGKEHPLTVVLHFQLIGVVAGAVSLFFNFQMPTGWDWLWLFLIGLFSQFGQMFLTNALQQEAVAGTVIVNYTGLIYGVTIGWIFFGEVQGAWTFVGMGLVVLGVAASVVYTKRLQRIASSHMTEA
jgi:drug/metabolite transporter (DMT)-like permease